MFLPIEEIPSSPLFLVKTCGRFHVTNKSELPITWKDDSSFFWILTTGGSAYFDASHRTQYLTPGWAFTVGCPPLKVVKFDPHLSSPWSGLYLSFSHLFATSRLEFVNERFGALNQISLSSRCVSLTRRLISEKTESFASHAVLALDWYHEWWIEAEEHHRKIVRLLDARVTASEFSREPHSLKSLADQLGYSPGYLSAMLRRRWKESPSQLLRRERLQFAADQLKTTNIRVEVLASQLGYRSVSSFIRVFRQTHGMPPEKYRKCQK